MSELSDARISLLNSLDDPAWRVAFAAPDVKVFIAPSRAGRLKIKAVSDHVASAERIALTLRDVLWWERASNPAFSGGALEDAWPTPEDPFGDRVRVRYRSGLLPDQDYVHGVHRVRHDARTELIVYTPRDDQLLPSGQRISQRGNGTVRVEQLIDGSVGGAWLQWARDTALLQARIKALVYQVRRLRTLSLPRVRDLDVNRMIRVARAQLLISREFETVHEDGGHLIQRGHLSTCPREVLRTTLTVPSPIDAVVKRLADRSLDFLPLWNDSFASGQELYRAEEGPRLRTVLKVRYKATWPHIDRELVYALIRERVSDNEAWLLYQSIDTGRPTSGCRRAWLYNAVHHLQSVPGGTQLTLLLAADLGGSLAEWRDTWLRGRRIEEHRRTMDQQLQWLAEL